MAKAHRFSSQQQTRHKQYCVFFELPVSGCLNQYATYTASQQGHTVGGQNPAPLATMESHYLFGIYRGIIIPRFLRWCSISFIHSMVSEVQNGATSSTWLVQQYLLNKAVCSMLYTFDWSD